jgi:hypothetical protein
MTSPMLVHLCDWARALIPRRVRPCAHQTPRSDRSRTTAPRIGGNRHRDLPTHAPSIASGLARPALAEHAPAAAATRAMSLLSAKNVRDRTTWNLDAAEAGPTFLRIEAAEISICLVGGGPVTARFRPRTGFAGRPRGLRRCILEALGRRDLLTAHDLAGIVYARRFVVRPAHRRHVTSSQLVATRRALRRLVSKGKIQVLHRGNAGRYSRCSGRSTIDRR